MIIGLVSLVTSSLKTGCRIEVRNLLIHAAKVKDYFGFFAAVFIFISAQEGFAVSEVGFGIFL